MADDVKTELEALLAKHQVELIGVPEYKSDGRGGWYLTVAVALQKKAK